MRKKVYILVVCLAAFLFSAGWTSCVHIPYEAKSEVTRQLDELKKNHEIDKAVDLAKLSGQKDKVIQSKDLQLQTISNSLYGANEGFKYYYKPGRLDIIINNRVTEAQAAVGVPPTYEAIVKENARLALELDETKTSLSQLSATHKEVVASNTKISDESKKQQAEIERLEKEQLTKDAAYLVKLNAKQDELNTVNSKIQSMLQQKADDEQATKELKQKLMLWCGIGALACLAGAIYSPVGKQGFVIGGIVLGGAAVAIPFITLWMVLVGVLVVSAICGVALAMKFNLLNKTNTTLVQGIQDDIENGSTTIKSSIKAWNTKYVKAADGSITEVPDKAVNNLIQSTLMKVGRLPTDVNPIETPTSGSIG
jgi:hypothetical protein